MGFLESYGLGDDFQINVECNHATLAGHSCEHEVTMASAYGIFGSLDANTGDPQTVHYESKTGSKISINMLHNASLA